MKKTPIEWLRTPEFAGVQILDPDGWDRNNFEESWNTPITLEEMLERVGKSTIMVKK